MVFTQEAASLLRERGERLSASKITALSGVHRKDAGHILREHTAPEVAAIDPIAKLMNLWESDNRFVDKNRTPKPLTWKAAQSEFAQLSREITTDVSPSSLIAELERRNLVRKVHDKLIPTEGYNRLPLEPVPRFLNLAKNVRYLFQAAVENLFASEEPRNAHLRTEFENLSSEQIGELRNWVLEENIEFHKRLRQKLTLLERDLHLSSKEDQPYTLSVTSYSLTFATPTEEKLEDTSS